MGAQHLAYTCSNGQPDDWNLNCSLKEKSENSCTTAAFRGVGEIIYLHNLDG